MLGGSVQGPFFPFYLISSAEFPFLLKTLISPLNLLILRPRLSGPGTLWGRLAAEAEELKAYQKGKFEGTPISDAIYSASTVFVFILS